MGREFNVKLYTLKDISCDFDLIIAGAVLGVANGSAQSGSADERKKDGSILRIVRAALHVDRGENGKVIERRHNFQSVHHMFLDFINRVDQRPQS